MSARSASALPPSDRPALLVVVGPNASGKTALGMDLAERLGGEIISADSVQVYRGMDVGSGKATAAEQRRVPHHCLDLAAPDEAFDAARFCAAADQAIATLHARGRRALVVGGTGLYVRALLHGLLEAPPAPDELRAALMEQAQRDGPAALHARLAVLDPPLAERLAPRDLPRILRGLEVHEITGRRLSDWQREHADGAPRYRSLVLGLRWPREELRDRIARRCRGMLDDGVVAEVQGLRAAGYGPSLRSQRVVGYKQVHAMLDGDLEPAAALDDQIRASQRYARRQMTWFRAVRDLHWVDAPPRLEPLLELVRARLGWAPATGGTP